MSCLGPADKAGSGWTKLHEIGQATHAREAGSKPVTGGMRGQVGMGHEDE